MQCLISLLADVGAVRCGVADVALNSGGLLADGANGERHLREKQAQSRFISGLGDCEKLKGMMERDTRIFKLRLGHTSELKRQLLSLVND